MQMAANGCLEGYFILRSPIRLRIDGVHLITRRYILIYLGSLATLLSRHFHPFCADRIFEEGGIGIEFLPNLIAHRYPRTNFALHW